MMRLKRRLYEIYSVFFLTFPVTWSCRPVSILLTAVNGPSGFKSKHLNMIICSLLSYKLNFQKMPPREFSVNLFLRYLRNQVHLQV